ncbi:MAG TPA: alpha/beta hydrolase [Planctomycetota bacterium]|nr:alpha/beta hydrolase [Planctomycetota bacterium]
MHHPMPVLVFVLATAVACASKQPSHASPSEPRTIDLPGRVALDYVEQGDESGVPVILLHGYSDSRQSFELVLPHLPPRLRVFALSQRGHGDSGRPESGYRTRDFAADVGAFIEAQGLGPAVVVGHSMGSTHAIRVALDFPDRTRGLVLVSTFDSYRENPVIVELWETGVSQLADPVDPAFVREFQTGTLAQPVPPEFFERAVRESLKLPARVWQHAFQGFLEDDFTGELARVRAPTLVLWGDRDVLCTRADQDTLLAAIAGSKLVVYEGTGHALHWEQPQRFAADLVAFVDGLPAVARQP